VENSLGGEIMSIIKRRPVGFSRIRLYQVSDDFLLACLDPDETTPIRRRTGRLLLLSLGLSTSLIITLLSFAVLISRVVAGE
jgi:hypothetical protein